MVVGLSVAVGILGVAVCVLTVRLVRTRQAVEEIAAAFTARLTEDTNTLIDLSCRDRQMRQLAATINRQLAKLRDERHRFQQGDTELKDAVTNISHDLRTPLTAICGYLALLEQEEKSETVSRYLSMIANRTEALKLLTEELFRYSVIVSLPKEERVSLALNDVLEENLAALYGAMTKRGMTPELHLTDTRVVRSLDRTALSRIFTNILGNALKYSDGDLAVTLSDDGTVRFTNTAHALDPVSVGRLFDRFFTVESGRGATGLGLSIAKLLTERMGGTIAAEYGDGKLSVLVRFPETGSPAGSPAGSANGAAEQTARKERQGFRHGI